MSTASLSKRCHSSFSSDGAHEANYSPLQEPASKRSRQYTNASHITKLSDELFLRIVSYLPTRDLASFQAVSRRCQRVAVDGQVWKALFYRRFVRPRAYRVPGVSRSAICDQKSHYSSRNSLWLDDEMISQATGTNWKRLYKLRHNWDIGSCAIRKVDVTSDHSSPCLDKPSDATPEKNSIRQKLPLLVKLHEGIVFTADASVGLRAWELSKESTGKDVLLAQLNVHSAWGDTSTQAWGLPTAMAIDDENRVGDGRLNVTVGFDNGGFVMYQLDMVSEKVPVFRTRYIQTHGGRETDPGPAAVTSIASLGPYLSVMRFRTWTIYDFSQSQRRSNSKTKDELAETKAFEKTEVKQGKGNRPHGSAREADGYVGASASCRMIHPHLQAPQILSELKSSTVWPPLSLSLRRSLNHTVLASIVYAYPLYVSGWSVGVQELHFETANQGISSKQAVLSGSRLATAVSAGFSPLSGPGSTPATATSGISSPRRTESAPARGFVGPESWTQSHQEDTPLARPTSLSYSHPYLLASHADNTLTLYMVRSTNSSLSIEPGQRLWGHTSAVSAVQVSGRGRAVSISNTGAELRIWGLEGGVSERRRFNASVKAEPMVGGRNRAQDAPHNPSDDVLSMLPLSADAAHDEGHSSPSTILAGGLGGFDEEKVVVLNRATADNSSGARGSDSISSTAPEGLKGRLELVIYDFTR